MASPNGGGGGRDRLSDLPDGVIGHVLSFLPTKEAARAAALARSWRHKFAYVDAISFVEHVAHYGPSDDDYTFFAGARTGRSSTTSTRRFSAAAAAPATATWRCVPSASSSAATTIGTRPW